MFLNLIFTYFFDNEQLRKIKEISSTSFYCIIPPLKIGIFSSLRKGKKRLEKSLRSLDTDI